MTADLRPDIKPGDTVTLRHPDGSVLANQKLTGTDRYVNPGGVPLDSLDKLLGWGWTVHKHERKYVDGVYAVNLSDDNPLATADLVVVLDGEVIRQGNPNVVAMLSEGDTLTSIVSVDEVVHFINHTEFSPGVGQTGIAATIRYTWRSYTS